MYAFTYVRGCLHEQDARNAHMLNPDGPDTATFVSSVLCRCVVTDIQIFFL